MDDEVQCLTNPYKAIQPGSIKLEARASDEIQITKVSSNSSVAASPTTNGPSTSGVISGTVQLIPNTLRSATPPDPTGVGGGAELEEIRMLRTLLQRATEKNRNLKLQKEKILLKRKILAVERENNVLKDEIGGLEKQTPPAGQPSTQPPHPGARVPPAQLPLRLNNNYNLQRQQQAKVAPQHQQHYRPNHAGQPVYNKHYQAAHQPSGSVARYQPPTAGLTRRPPLPWAQLQHVPGTNVQNRAYAAPRMQKPLNHLPSGTHPTQGYYVQSQHQQPQHQQPQVGVPHQTVQHQQQQQHAVQQQQQQQHVAQQQHAAQAAQQHAAQQQAAQHVNRLQHVSSMLPRHSTANNGAALSSNALAAVGKYFNNANIANVVGNSLSTAANNLTSAHNTLLNNHTGHHPNTQRQHIHRGIVQSNANNTVEVNIHKAPSMSGRVQSSQNENQIGKFLKSALEKGGYENLLMQMQKISQCRSQSNTPVLSNTPDSVVINTSEIAVASTVESVVNNALEGNVTMDTAVSSELILPPVEGNNHTAEDAQMDNTVQISVGNEDAEVDIDISSDNTSLVADYSTYNSAPDNAVDFSDLFSVADDTLNLASQNISMTSSNENSVTTPTDDPSQQPYDLSKLDTATLKQLLSSVCSFCSGDVTGNKLGEPEELLTCCDCSLSGHPSCLQFSSDLTEKVKTYAWQCIECKTCVLCGLLGDDNKLMFCDHCDKGFHTDCLTPVLLEVPEGSWSCDYCRGISVPAEGSVSKASSNSRDVILQKANKVINLATSERTPAEMLQKTEEIIASLLAQGRKRTKSSESHSEAPSSKRHLQDI